MKQGLKIGKEVWFLLRNVTQRSRVVCLLRGPRIAPGVGACTGFWCDWNLVVAAIPALQNEKCLQRSCSSWRSPPSSENISQRGDLEGTRRDLGFRPPLPRTVPHVLWRSRRVLRKSQEKVIRDAKGAVWIRRIAIHATKNLRQPRDHAT